MSKNGCYLDVDGSSIYYEVTGNLKGKPLVLLHGGLGCIYDFDCILSYIPSDYMIIAVDFRGHGKSFLGSENLSYSRYQKDIESLLTYLGINKFSIFGFSDGGIVG